MSYDPFASTVPVDNETSKNGSGRTVAIVAAAVLVVAIAVVGTLWLLDRDGDAPLFAATPSPSADVETTPSRSPSTDVETVPSPVPSADVDPGHIESPEILEVVEVDEDALERAEALGFSPVAFEMEIDEIEEHYSELFESGKLFEELIPHTEEGILYVGAFVMKITDYKAAASFGANFDGPSRGEFSNLERQFLAVADMDLDIRYTRADGSVFTHDGTAPTFED